MNDGIALSPYPILANNSSNGYFVASNIKSVPEHKVTFESAPEVKNYATSTTEAKTTLSTIETNHDVAKDSAEALATLELKKEKIKERFKEKDKLKDEAATEVENIKNGQKCLLGVGAVLTFFTLAVATVAFGTPEWRIYTVDQKTLPPYNPSLNFCSQDQTSSSCQFFSSRVRGLFVTCYQNNTMVQSTFASDRRTSTGWSGYSCVWEQKYNLPNTIIITGDNCNLDPTTKNSRNMVEVNANLMRTQWTTFAIAIIFLFLGLLFSLISCCRLRVKGSMFAGVVVLLATIFILVSMAFYLGYMYVEEVNLRCLPFYGFLQKDTYSEVIKSFSASYGFSFYLGWVSVAIGIVASAFLLAAACQRQESQKKIDKALDQLEQILKDERAEKRFEEAEEKRKRKEFEKSSRRDSISSTISKKSKPSIFSTSKPKEKKKKPMKTNVSDSEIDYDVRSKTKGLNKEKERRLKELRLATELEIEKEKNKLKIRKDRELKELEKVERDLNAVESRIKSLEDKKKHKERRRELEEEDEISDESSGSDREFKRRSTKRKSSRRRRHRSDDSIRSSNRRRRSDDSIRSSNGPHRNTDSVMNSNWLHRNTDNVVNIGWHHRNTDSGMNIGADPFTLHLPTGVYPPPYRP